MLLGAILVFTRFGLRIRQDGVCVLFALSGMMLFVILFYRAPALSFAALLTALVVIYRHREALGF